MTLRLPTLLMLATLALPLAAAAGATTTVGASGRCFDDGTTGGDAGLEIVDGTITRMLDPAEVVAALSALLTGPGNPAAGSGCASSGDDHLEVHASWETEPAGVPATAGDVQVCYNGAILVNPDAC